MSAAARGGLGGWRLHGACALLLALELACFRAWHRGNEALAWEVVRGTSRQRIDALRILANRGTPDPALFGEPLVRRLLADPDDLMKEFAFTHEIDKFGDSGLQALHVFHYRGADVAHWWRSYFLHAAKVGGGPRLDRKSLAWWFDAVAERPPPLLEARQYIVRARDLAARRRQVLGSELED